MVVRNELKHGLPGFERIALWFSTAAAEKNQARKTPQGYLSFAEIRHRASSVWLDSVGNGFQVPLFRRWLWYLMFQSSGATSGKKGDASGRWLRIEAG